MGNPEVDKNQFGCLRVFCCLQSAKLFLIIDGMEIVCLEKLLEA